MSDLREAAQQALEVLEQLQGGCTDSNDGTVDAITVWCPEVIGALRAALEQEQAEPKRYIVTNNEFLVTGNEFYGAPPAPYANWGEAMATMLDAGVIEGLRISALEQKD